MKSTLLSIIALLGLGAVLPCQAGVHTFSDFTRPANAAGLTETFDFVPNEGWSGTPPNAITGEASVYLKMTVSWAAASNIGTFQARFIPASLCHGIKPCGLRSAIRNRSLIRASREREAGTSELLLHGVVRVRFIK